MLLNKLIAPVPMGRCRPSIEQTCIGQIQGERFAKAGSGVKTSLGEVFQRLRGEAPELYAPGAKRKSDFFPSNPISTIT